jgi:hypothetical protein
MTNTGPVSCHNWDKQTGIWRCEYVVGSDPRAIILFNGYCPNCGAWCAEDGTVRPQVPWARAQQAERMLGEVGVECIRLNKALNEAEAQKAEAVEYVLNRLRDVCHELSAEVIPYVAYSGDPVTEEGRIGYSRARGRDTAVMLGSIEGIRHGLATVAGAKGEGDE